MRAVSDRALSGPYRRWIDGAMALPPDVVLVPRTIDVTRDALMLLAATLPMGAVSVFFLLMGSRVRPETDGWAPFLFLWGIGLALWIAPVLLLRRLVRTVGAASDRARGALRQGIFVGTEGALVRMEPDRCHPIAPDRFVSAIHVGPLSTAHAKAATVEVETLDGTITLFADRLDGHPGRIVEAARTLWPAGSQARKRPKARVKADHTRANGVLRAMKIAGLSVVLLFFVLGVLRVAGASWSTPGVTPAVLGLGLLIVGAVLNVAIQWVRMSAFYRCPKCGGKTRRVPAALPAIRYLCAPCNVEWDSGVEERDLGD